MTDSDSGLDKTYKPSSKDLNSTDSEYSSDASKNTERQETEGKNRRLVEKALKKSQ